MANSLKLVGNSIQLNRNLSSNDGGVLGPFTIQATQNGMSAAANFNLTVGGATPPIGPVPLPSPYPLQPGFTPISDPSQITGPGKYQLTADVPDLHTIGGRLIPLSQVDQYLGLAGRIRNGTGFDFFGRC